MSSIAMTGQSRNFKRLAITLSAMATLASLAFVLATPFRTTTISTWPDAQTTIQHSYLKLSMILVLLQLVAASLTFAAATLLWRGKSTTARRLLIAGAVFGISVVPVPSALALGAYVASKRYTNIQ